MLLTSVLGARCDGLEGVARARLGDVVGIVDAAKESAAKVAVVQVSTLAGVKNEVVTRANWIPRVASVISLRRWPT